jgi:hypothetical protein
VKAASRYFLCCGSFIAAYLATCLSLDADPSLRLLQWIFFSASLLCLSEALALRFVDPEIGMRIGMGAAIGAIYVIAIKIIANGSPAASFAMSVALASAGYYFLFGAVARQLILYRHRPADDERTI